MRRSGTRRRSTSCTDSFDDDDEPFDPTEFTERRRRVLTSVSTGSPRAVAGRAQPRRRNLAAADPRLPHRSIAAGHGPEGRMSLPDQMTDRWQARVVPPDPSSLR